MSKNQESVKLIIEAENLANEEFKKASDEVKALAKESEEADKRLNQLEIDKATIKSYGLLGAEINDLKDEIIDATEAQKAALKEHGKTSTEYKTASKVVSVLNNDLASLKKAYTAQGNQLKKYRVDSKEVENTVKDLNEQIEQGTVVSKENAAALKQANDRLEEAKSKHEQAVLEKEKLIEAEKELSLKTQQFAKDLKEEFDAQNKLNAETIAAVKAKEKQEAAAKKQQEALQREKEEILATKHVLELYEKGLNDLHKERETGSRSQADFIRGEVELRETLSLTKAQVTDTKKAWEAEVKAVRDAAEAAEKLDREKQIAITKELKEKSEAFAKAMEAEFKAQEKLNKEVLAAAEAKRKLEAEADKLKAAQEREREEIIATQHVVSMYEKELAELNSQRIEGTKSQADYIRAEAELRKSLKLTSAQVTDVKKAFDAEAKAAKDADKESAKVEAAMNSYSAQLKELNERKNKGLISSERLADAETDLRKKYALTEAQVEDTRKAILSNDEAIKKSKSNTDLLTQSTRRLAQVYTLLLASSKAIEAIGASVTQFGEIEGAMTGVEKTTNMAREQVQGLKDQLNDMAENITPTATKELLNYAEVAGQLGVNTKQGILDLAVAADALGISTNLAGDEAVTLLTRMLLMSGEGVESIHNLSSSVVELGNNFAVAEDEIVHMGREILTATASIGLSTDKAMAFGAVLKESGQQAERSRTAIQRLAQMIKKASVEGGEDLLKLTEITGMTAEAIQKGLGEEPEQVLLSFAEGLNRIKEEGGVVSTTLESVGISSLESQAVLEKLGDVSMRLAQSFILSGEAAQKADKHLIESSKRYADQESAIGRVQNQLKGLGERLGQAFSDETQGAINGTTDALKKYEGAMVTLANITADTLSGIVEFVAPVEGTFDAIGEAASELAYTVKFAFNGLQNGIDLILLGWQKIAFNLAKMTGESDEQIAKLASGIEATTKRMEVNQKDMADSLDLIMNRTSLSYIGLRETIEGNEDAVKSLTEAQQLELKGLMRKGAYSKAENERYEELTALITRQSRALEIADEQKSAQAANDRAREAAAAKAAKEDARLTEEALQLKEKLEGKLILLADYTKDLTDKLKAGTITQEEYNQKATVASKLIDLNAEKTQKEREATEALNEAKKEDLKSTESLVKLRQDETESAEQLVLSIQKQEQEIVKLQVQQVGLNKTSEKYLELQKQIDEVNRVMALSSSDLTTLRKLEDLTLSDLVEVQEKHEAKLVKLKELRNQDKITIQEYNEEVEKLSVTTEFLDKNLSDVIATQKEKAEADKKAIEDAQKLKEAQEKEAEAAAKAALQHEIESKTITELIALKAEHDEKLDALLAKYERGEITWAKYQAELAKMKTVTDILSQALANNTEAVADNISKLDEQAESLTRNEKLQKRLAEAADDLANKTYSAFSAQKSTFDASTASLDELNDKIKVYENTIAKNGKVTDRWWKHIAQSQIAMDKASLATARQARQVLKLKQQYENMENPTRKSTEAILQNINALGDLDSATLDNLKADVLQTISYFDSLKDSISDSLDGVQDRLDALRGDEIAIKERAQAREIEEAKAMVDEASGDSEASKMAKQYLSKLKQAHDIEMSNLKQEQAESAAAAKAAEAEAAAKAKADAAELAALSNSTSSSKQDKVVINLDNKSTEIEGDKDDIMSLLSNLGYTLS